MTGGDPQDPPADDGDKPTVARKRTALTDTQDAIVKLVDDAHSLAKCANHGDWAQTANLALSMGALIVQAICMVAEEVAYVAERVDALDTTVMNKGDS